MMSLETEQKLIDDLHKCVSTHPYKDELLALMHEQLDDDLMTCTNVHNQQ